MAPPPTPASLADLPGPWLLKLAGSDSFKRQNATLWHLSRTCSLFRDLVLRQRKATAEFRVPIAAEDFPRELRRLCTLAKSSRNIRLSFVGPFQRLPWTAAEPHIAHLLLCAMAQLGGQPLTAVKEIVFYGLQQTSLVPMWLPLTCPNFTSLERSGGTITDNLPLPAPPPPPSSRPAPAPVACQHLQRLHLSDVRGVDPQHLRQQLAALPSLSSLTVLDPEGLLAELHSASLTRLWLVGSDQDNEEALTRAVQRLPVQFPNLVELGAVDCLTLTDDGLEALLSMRSLRRVKVQDFRLERSHAQRRCDWEELSLETPLLVVDQLARLPLEGIQRLRTSANSFSPSRDAQAVARVAAIIKRSGGLGAQYGLPIIGGDAAALLTSLHPLLEAVMEEVQRKVTIAGMVDATPEVVQQLGQQLTPSVRSLRMWKCTLAPEAFPALLPSLPATVSRVCLEFGGSPPELLEERVLAMCGAAVRPINVYVGMDDLHEEEALKRIRARLAEQGNTHVTLGSKVWFELR